MTFNIDTNATDQVSTLISLNIFKRADLLHLLQNRVQARVRMESSFKVEFLQTIPQRAAESEGILSG